MLPLPRRKTQTGHYPSTTLHYVCWALRKEEEERQRQEEEERERQRQEEERRRLEEEERLRREEAERRQAEEERLRIEQQKYVTVLYNVEDLQPSVGIVCGHSFITHQLFSVDLLQTTNNGGAECADCSAVPAVCRTAVPQQPGATAGPHPATPGAALSAVHAAALPGPAGPTTGRPQRATSWSYFKTSHTTHSIIVPEHSLILLIQFYYICLFPGSTTEAAAGWFGRPGQFGLGQL